MHQPNHRQKPSYLEGDVIELAAVADGRSAGMDHAVHLNNARAAPRSFPGPFPGGAPRRRAAGCGFAFGCLLARHFSRILNYHWESQLKQSKQTNKQTKEKPKRTGLLTRWNRSGEMCRDLFVGSPARWTHVRPHLSLLKLRVKLSRNAKTLSFPLLFSRFLL